MNIFDADSKCKVNNVIEFLPEYDSSYTRPITTDNRIQHIVIAGGGTMGLSYYGILSESSMQNVWHIDDIVTIYGTSIGAILSTILCLRYDWNTLDEYLIKRPWEKVFHYDLHTLFSCVQNNGIFGRAVTEQILKPLLLGKDIPVDVTMAEFFQHTGIELHIMTTLVSTFELVDISVKTHPQWSLIDAVHASCAIPFLFKPIEVDGELYCDGGFCVNYPILQCIDNGAKYGNILGIQMTSIRNEEVDTTTFSLFDYIVHLSNKMLNKLCVNYEYKIQQFFSVSYDSRSLTNITDVAENRTTREALIQSGRETFRRQYTSPH